MPRRLMSIFYHERTRLDAKNQVLAYAHKWCVGDLVIWDNRCTMPRASPFDSNDHMRELRRTTIIDTRGDAVAR
ncbi:MAG: TauD/TfdA family dioxygenase [Xanthobacteraceae bacterium]